MMSKAKKGGQNTKEKRTSFGRISPNVLYGSLAALGIIAIFFVGMLLGKAYHMFDLTGASAIRRLRSGTGRPIEQVQLPTEPFPTPAATSSVVEVPRVSPEELKDKLDSGADLVIVDLRDKEAFDEGHIKGAVSIPLSEIEARYGELKGDKEIVFYGDRC